MHNFRQLIVWEKAMDLVVELYTATADFPKEEKYGLTSQMRRSVISIASNIAEGAGRNSDKEFCQYLAIAHASSYELETQVLVAERLGLFNTEVAQGLCNRIVEIQKMSHTLQHKLNPQLLSTNKS